MSTKGFRITIIVCAIVMALGSLASAIGLLRDTGNKVKELIPNNTVEQSEEA